VPFRFRFLDKCTAPRREGPARWGDPAFDLGIPASDQADL
jgi:hypothetical protein